MCLDYLFFKKRYGLTKPSPLIKIDADEFRGYMVSNFPNCAFRWQDKKYKVTNLSEYRRFLDWDDTDKQLYIPESYDCDDFAIRLHGNITIPFWSSLPFGHCYVTIISRDVNHAVNIFVDNEGDVYFVEPQDDNIYSIDSKKDWNPYFIEI